MDDLVTWLKAQVDEDERVARLAGGGEWTRDGGSIYAGHPTDEVVDWVYGEAWEHIALHDPARVLREVEAKRRILARHNVPAVVWPQDSFYVRTESRRCVGCGFGSDEEAMVPDVNDCPVLLALAYGYGYDEEPAHPEG